MIADLSGIEARGAAFIVGDLRELEQWRLLDRSGKIEDDPYFITGGKTFPPERPCAGAQDRQDRTAGFPVSRRSRRLSPDHRRRDHLRRRDRQTQGRLARRPSALRAVLAADHLPGGAGDPAPWGGVRRQSRHAQIRPGDPLPRAQAAVREGVAAIRAPSSTKTNNTAASASPSSTPQKAAPGGCTMRSKAAAHSAG